MRVKTFILPLASMLLASAFGCASVRPPDLPPVREYTPDAERSVPGVEDASKKPLTRTYELRDLVEDMASREGIFPATENGEALTGAEKKSAAFELLSVFLKAMFPLKKGKIAVNAETMSFTLDNVPEEVHDEFRNALYELKSKTKPVFKVILLEVEFDPESIRNWDVLLKPLSSLPAGGDGQALSAVVPFRDFKAWLDAAVKTDTARAVTHPTYQIYPLETLNTGFCGQTAYGSHYEKTIKDGKEVLESEYGSISHGVEARFRALFLNTVQTAVIRFEITQRGKSCGNKLWYIKTTNRMQHLPNMLGKTLRGTARIPPGCCLLVITGPAAGERLVLFAIRTERVDVLMKD